MNLNTDRIDDAVLALLLLGLHDVGIALGSRSTGRRWGGSMPRG